MTFQESESDPLSFLASTAKHRNRMVLTMQGHRHWVTSGHLDHSAASAGMRSGGTRVRPASGIKSGRRRSMAPRH